MKRPFFWLHGILAVVGLCGILLRMDWGRMVAVVVCVLLAAYMLYRAILAIIAGIGLGIDGLLYVLLLVGGLGAVGYYLPASPRIRSFFNQAKAENGLPPDPRQGG